MASSFPIGVFDSGVGGLSILEKIHHLLPQENLLYVADSAHAPYGAKGDEVILQRCQAVMSFFEKQKVKAVVLACNTATAVAVAQLREQYTLPIVGMEPALKPAALKSRSGIVGVLATEGTIKSDKFHHLKSRFSNEVEIITQACPGLVEKIEQLTPDKNAIRDLLSEFIAPLKSKGVDTLVLGCTHYSLINDLIAELAGAEMEILDTGDAVAIELQRRLVIEGLLNEAKVEQETLFFSSVTSSEQEVLLSNYWGQQIKVSSL